MNNNGSYDNARHIWEVVFDKRIDDSSEIPLKIEEHKKLLSIFSVGNYFYYIFNLMDSNFDYISDGVRNVLGFEPSDTTVEKFVSNMHPDDIPFFLDFEKTLVEFYTNLEIEKIVKYKIQYDYRVKSSSGKYIRLLHQSVMIQYDEKHNFYRTLGLDTDISHIKLQGIPTLSIIGLEGEPSFYNVDVKKHFIASTPIFTTREREVLKGIIEGKTSNEIADILFLSKHTIDSHRKNIIEKSNTKTIAELVNKALNEGWV